MIPKFRKNLQRLLQNVFWNDFMDVIQEEFLNLKSQMNEKRYLYNPRELDSIDELRQINKSFGTFVDLTLLDDYTDEEILEYMRQETEGLIFKVRYKGSYEYFKYVFNRVYEKGQTYLMFINDTGGILQKGIDYEQSLENFLTHDITKPFVKVPPIFPTFDQKVERYTLDTPDLANFDTGWRYDPYLVGQTLNITKHMVVEFTPTSLYNKEGGSELYLLTPKYFRYLERAINNKVQRKTTTIPHIGVQINLYTDESGDVFTIPDLEASCNVTTNYSRDYVKVKAGNNEDGLFYERELSDNEIYTLHPTYNLINTWVPARRIYPEVIAQGDGSNTEFDSEDALYDPLKYPTIEKKSFRVYWTHNEVSYTGYDDGEGNVTADDDEIDGTIDYTTGDYHLFFYRDSDTTSFAPDNETDILTEYSTSQSLTIDQVYIQDDEDNDLIYGTFAPVEFYSKENHISIHFIVEKTS